LYQSPPPAYFNLAILKELENFELPSSCGSPDSPKANEIIPMNATTRIIPFCGGWSAIADE
jgi:hypothetical protein